MDIEGMGLARISKAESSQRGLSCPMFLWIMACPCKSSQLPCILMNGWPSKGCQLPCILMNGWPSKVSAALHPHEWLALQGLSYAASLWMAGPPKGSQLPCILMNGCGKIPFVWSSVSSTSYNCRNSNYCISECGKGGGVGLAPMTIWGVGHIPYLDRNVSFSVCISQNSIIYNIREFRWKPQFKKKGFV